MKFIKIEVRYPLLEGHFIYYIRASLDEAAGKAKDHMGYMMLSDFVIDKQSNSLIKNSGLLNLELFMDESLRVK